MRTYIIRRILLFIPTVFFVSLIVFVIVRLVPGDVIDIMEAQYGTLAHLDRAAITHALGYDVPIYTQYGRWIERIVVHGDLGNSLWKAAPVLNEIETRFPVTLELGIMAFIITQIIALPIGVYSALRQDTVGDYIGRSFAILCIAVPSFWLATLVIVYPGIWWHYSMPLMYIHFSQDPIGNLKYFIIPAVILGMSGMGSNMRLMRTMMLEVLRQDYIRTAWAKGLRERVIVMRHALKNALIPVVTMMGGQLTIIISGSVIIENIFNTPGLGQYMMNATSQRDYPAVSAITLIFSVGLVIINLATDLTYGFLDPRVHYK
jgi:peptide/nickel transport system permease protein